MQIVIDIPDGIYDFLVEHPDRQFPYATEWVRQGTPLPKGHGRLKDVDAVIGSICKHCDGLCERCTVTEIDRLPTLVEADKEVSDGR